MTRTSTEYKPRHKRPEGWAGSTPRGPHRWARAASNALTHPTSQAAQLYRNRVANADFFHQNYDDAKRPFEFKRDDKRTYVTCSLYCAVMQIQLEYGTVDRMEIRRIFQGNWSRTRSTTVGNSITGECRELEWTTDQYTFVDYLDKKTLKRATRCQCCGTAMRPKK